MAANTPNEVTVYDLPGNVTGGTARRRVIVAINTTIATAGDTILLDNNVRVPNIGDIEGIMVATADGAVAVGTAVTWTGPGTVSVDGTAGVYELLIMANIT